MSELICDKCHEAPAVITFNRYGEASRWPIEWFCEACWLRILETKAAALAPPEDA